MCESEGERERSVSRSAGVERASGGILAREWNPLVVAGSWFVTGCGGIILCDGCATLPRQRARAKPTPYLWLKWLENPSYSPCKMAQVDVSEASGVVAAGPGSVMNLWGCLP
jgi:hypothetical protein